MLDNSYLKKDIEPATPVIPIGNTDIVLSLESVERATFVVDNDFDTNITTLEAAYSVLSGTFYKVSSKLNMLKNNECTVEELGLIQLNMFLAHETLCTLGVKSEELNLPTFEHNYDSKLLASNITYEGVVDFITRMFEMLGRLLESIFGKRRAISAGISNIIKKELVLKKIDLSKVPDITLVIKKEELETLYTIYCGVIHTANKSLLESIFLSATSAAAGGAKYIKALPSYYKELEVAFKKAVDEEDSNAVIDLTIVKLPETGILEPGYQAALASETTRHNTTDTPIKKYIQDNNYGALQRILLINNNIFMLCAKTFKNLTLPAYVASKTLDSLEKLPKDVLAGEPDTSEIPARVLAESLNKLIDAIAIINSTYETTNYEKTMLETVNTLHEYIKNKVTNQDMASDIIMLANGLFKDTNGNPGGLFTLNMLTKESGLISLANATFTMYNKKIEEHSKNNTPQPPAA